MLRVTKRQLVINRLDAAALYSVARVHLWAHLKRCLFLRPPAQGDYEHLIYEGAAQWWEGLSFLFMAVSSGLFNEPHQLQQ